MGLTAVQTKVSKVVDLEGEKRQMANSMAAERGASITITCCMKAAENFAPLMIIFPRKNENKLLTKVALFESFGAYHPSGWIRTPLFLEKSILLGDITFIKIRSIIASRRARDSKGRLQLEITDATRTSDDYTVYANLDKIYCTDDILNENKKCI